MLIGIFSPKLVVPILSRQWSATELEMIVAHEICHYKKKDLVLKLLMMVTCCINWFNPFIYMMKRQFFYDMELACDGNVLLECNVEEREVYARLLLIFAGKTKPASVFSTDFGERKKWMKKRIDYMLNTGCKKKGIFSIIVTGIVIMTMTVFVSCGYKPNETDSKKQSDQTGIDVSQENGASIQEDIEEKDIVQEEIQPPFDYNHEYNEMLRCYEDNVYLAGADGIYCIREGGAKELIYENSYRYQRGMEVYQNFLYFCGSVKRGENEAATIYRMNLDTQEVEDALAMFSQVFDVLYNISIYDGNLYVVNGFESKRSGFELNQNGQIIRQLDEKEEGFLYKQHNECMDIEWKMMNVSYGSEEYPKLIEESKKRYYSVMDVAACKKLLQGKQVVSKYKDEMYRSIFLESEDGTYEFLCDTAYYLPLLVTETGIYYATNERGDIGYVDYTTKISEQLYMVKGTDEVALVNYDADYIYLLNNSNVGLDANNDWIEETYLLRVPRKGGEAEIVYQFEGDLQE